VYVSTTGLGGTGIGRYRVIRRLRRAGHDVVPTGELVLWDPQRLVGRTVERTYRIALGRRPAR
jgi:hypothetical protein